MKTVKIKDLMSIQNVVSYRYQVNEKVWLMYENKPVTGTVNTITLIVKCINQTEVEIIRSYMVTLDLLYDGYIVQRPFGESLLFTSKEELIKSL